MTRVFELLYETWSDPQGIMCWCAGASTDDLRQKLHPLAVLVRTHWAASHEHAMQQHYAAEGWGEYKSMPGISDRPFREDEFLAQQAYLRNRGAD